MSKATNEGGTNVPGIWAALAADLPVAWGVCDAADGRLLWANARLLEWARVDDAAAIGTGWLDWPLPTDQPAMREAWQACVANGSPQAVECQLPPGESGEERRARLRLQPEPIQPPSRVLLVVEDVTEWWQRTRVFSREQKLDAVIRLAAGFAHGFNNILAIVQGYADLALAEPQLPPAVRKALEEICVASDRGAGLTRQLLTLGGKQRMQCKKLDLNDLIHASSAVLRRILGPKNQLELVASSKPVEIKGDAAMLEQVFVNLTSNARDAMPEGGRLRVSVFPVDPAALSGRKLSESPEPVACVKFEDNGCGMTPEVLARIFEPFFTSKESRGAVGLGLTTVYSIIQQHGGWVEVQSQLGQGSTFCVFVPMIQTATPSLTMQRNTASSNEAPTTILVVEDELSLRSIVESILQSQGYAVLTASTGAEALEVWKEHGQTIDLLLTDIVMPEGMTGYELAKELRAENPELSVIYTSGYSPDLITDASEELQEGINFLQKPYRPQRLIETIRHCLEGRSCDLSAAG